MKNAIELEKHLTVKPLEPLRFEGANYGVGSPQIYGGQVLAQAINAASQTVDAERQMHSLHGYFILPGDLAQPVEYCVDAIRDGGSFSVRRVLAKQNNEVLFILATSFQREIAGEDFQTEQPATIPPDGLPTSDELYAQLKDFLPETVKKYLAIPLPFDIKYTDLPNPLAPENMAPRHGVWLKLKGEQPDGQELRKQMLTYISDYNILTTALRPFGEKLHFGNTQLASLDHAMWFHRDLDLSDWILYDLQLISASGGRAYVQGKFFDRNGNLLATATQEGLMRERTKKTKS